MIAQTKWAINSEWHRFKMHSKKERQRQSERIKRKKMVDKGAEQSMLPEILSVEFY